MLAFARCPHHALISRMHFGRYAPETSPRFARGDTWHTKRPATWQATWQSCFSCGILRRRHIIYMLLAAVLLHMSFTELPLPSGTRVPDGAFKSSRSSSRAHRSLLMRSRLETPLKQQVMDLKATADIVEHELFSGAASSDCFARPGPRPAMSGKIGA